MANYKKMTFNEKIRYNLDVIDFMLKKLDRLYKRKSEKLLSIPEPERYEHDTKKTLLFKNRINKRLRKILGLSNSFKDVGIASYTYKDAKNILTYLKTSNNAETRAFLNSPILQNIFNSFNIINERKVEQC